MQRDRLASRRSVLKFGAAAMLSLTPVSAFAKAKMPTERWLRFDNLHTGEKLKTVFWQNGKYLTSSLRQINFILRDFRTGEVKAIDQDLLDLLHVLSNRLETQKPFEVISGYRSPETNAMLAARSSRVARNSYHVRGMAIDVRVPGRELINVKRAALALNGGGVGYYPQSNFVHVDVGPVRDW